MREADVRRRGSGRLFSSCIGADTVMVAATVATDVLHNSTGRVQSKRFCFVSSQEGTMKLRLIQISFAVALAVHGLAQADDTNSQTGPLGKVSFPTSCDSKVQPAFERAVAMLHSFWYSAGEKAFRDVLKDDPQCAIATWGIASILMSNPLRSEE